jgi:hypothetical protein
MVRVLKVVLDVYGEVICIAGFHGERENPGYLVIGAIRCISGGGDILGG